MATAKELNELTKQDLERRADELRESLFRFPDHYVDSLDRRFVSCQIAHGPIALQVIVEFLSLIIAASRGCAPVEHLLGGRDLSTAKAF